MFWSTIKWCNFQWLNQYGNVQDLEQVYFMTEEFCLLYIQNDCGQHIIQRILPIHWRKILAKKNKNIRNNLLILYRIINFVIQGKERWVRTFKNCKMNSVILFYSNRNKFLDYTNLRFTHTLVNCSDTLLEACKHKCTVHSKKPI